MKNYISILFFIKICLFPLSCFSQNNKSPGERSRTIDSLLALLINAREDTGKVNNLNYLGWELKKNNIDTSILLSKQAVELAEKLCAVRPALSAQITQAAKTGLANSLGSLGVYYRNKGDYDLALDYFFRALKLDEDLNYKKGIAVRFGNIGLTYSDKGDYPRALDYYFKALKMGEEMGDKTRVSIQLGNIGIVYHDQGDLQKALEYYIKALKLGEELNNKKGVALRLGNIGLVYENMGDNSKALSYYQKAYAMFEELGDKNGMGIWLGNIGNIYKEQKDYEKAMDCYLRALKLRQELGSKKLIATCLGNIGGLYTLKKNYKEAFNYLQQAVALSSEIGSLPSLKMQYKMTSMLYEESTVSLPDTIGGKMLNTEQMRLRALYFYKKHIAIGDTLFSEENKKQLVRKEMNFDFEKKEAATKAEQDKKDAITKEELKQKEQQRNYFIIGFGLVALLAVFIFRSYRQKQKANTLITEQKKIVDEHQKEILDSIRYAKRIQSALLPTDKYVSKNLNRLTKN